MGNRVVRFIRTIVVFCYSMSFSISLAADGDVFTANTVEGVEMRFQVINETNKMCRVHGGLDNQCILKTTSGNITIPSEVNGYAVTSIGESAFYFCENLTNIIIPSSVISIEAESFCGCGMTNISIPNSVTTIGSMAFHSCINLTDITIPNSVISIEDYAFGACLKLTSITIPNSVMSIESYTFANCTGLKDVTIGNSVTKIGLAAFDGCTALTSITIPKSVTSIEDIVLRECTALTNLVVEDGNKKYDSRDGCNAVIETATNTLIVGCKNSVIPNTVTSIGNRAFEAAFSLTDIAIPNSVTNIGAYAFNCCRELASITIPNSVTSIGEWAFAGNWQMKSVVSEIEDPFDIADNVFDKYVQTLYVPFGTKAKYEKASGWNQLSNIVELDYIFTEKTTEGLEMTYKAIDRDRRLCQLGDGTNSAVSFDDTDLISIPTMANGYTVVKIGDQAFLDGHGIKRIIIPNTIKDIGIRAFYGCTELDDIVSEIVEPFDVSDDAFQYKDNDTDKPLDATLTVPFNTKVKYEETNGWKQLAITENHPDDGAVFLAETAEGVEVAYKVTDGQEWLCQFGEGDGKTAFDAVGVKQITIPAQVKGCTVTSIADGAFSGCTSLLSVSFPETVTAIDTEALKDCCDLAAILWNAETEFPKEALASAADNPNLLLYVKNKSNAPNTVGNVVVNGTAPDIILKDADYGSNFYCPQAFTATKIEYEHEYTMKTGYGECRGWETIALPFDVTRITHEKGMALVPITSDWNPKNSNSRPFWLYEESANGWQPATAIKANTPYLISMPNNDTHYESSYNVNGRVVFVGENVQVQPSQSLNIAQRGDRSFVPNFQHQPTSTKIYALNINDASKFNEGSVFIRELRAVHPFEAYMTLEGSNAGIRSIPVFDNETTGMTSIPVSGFGNTDAIYNLNGQRVNSMSRGIYIQNGRKIVKK